MARFNTSAKKSIIDIIIIPYWPFDFWSPFQTWFFETG